MWQLWLQQASSENLKNPKQLRKQVRKKNFSRKVFLLFSASNTLWKCNQEYNDTWNFWHILILKFDRENSNKKWNWFFCRNSLLHTTKINLPKMLWPKGSFSYGLAKFFLVFSAVWEDKQCLFQKFCFSCSIVVFVYQSYFRTKTLSYHITTFFLFQRKNAEQ